MNGPTPPNTLYRFRSIDALLDKYHELEKEHIYIANPEELNDPMEGLRDIVWKGDKIVWTNFFRHYVYCSHQGLLQAILLGDSKELDPQDIPVLNIWDQITPEVQGSVDHIWDRFLHLPYIPEIIEALSNSSRKIRYTELGYYFQLIHPFLLPEILDAYIEHGLIPESQRPVLPDQQSAPVIFKSILKSIVLFNQARTEQEINFALQQIAMINYKHRLQHQKIIRQHKHLIPSELYWKNRQLMFADFPAVYLKEIERLLFPKWYTASFMEHYHNSSVWGHYAAGHKGACLIFQSDGFELYHGAAENVRPTRLAKIRYITKPAEVDFYRSISRLTVKDAKEHWYTDDEGNISECASHIPFDGDMDSTAMRDWQKRHWDTFYRDITAKTSDWKYEQEYRLILEDRLRQFDDKKTRKLKYDFNLLKGIIFGIKTSDEHRLRIIDIIEKKCEDYGRTDFKFYQAYYSPDTSDIRKFEVQVDDTA